MSGTEGLWAPLFGWVATLPDAVEILLGISVAVAAITVSWLAVSNTVHMRELIGFLQRRGGAGSSPHLTCPYRDDGEAYSHATREHEHAATAGHAELLRKQMDHLEQKLTAMTGELRSIMITVMSERPGIKDPLRTRDCKNYHLALKVFYSEMSDIARQYFKENGFSKMTQPEFEEYKATKTVALLYKGTEILDMYYDGETVTREELYVANKQFVPKIEKMIADTLDNARALAIEYEKDLDAKSRAFEYYHDRFRKRWGKEEQK